MGPTAGVLVTKPESYEFTWRNVMRDLADSWSDGDIILVRDTKKFGGSYKGDSLPFMGQICDLSKTASTEEIEAIHQATGKRFTHCIELGAGCKSNFDHLVLCEIARYLADLFHGYVDFGSIIAPEDACTGLLNVSWSEEDYEDYMFCSTQIGSPAACTWWLSQPNFHMIK